MYKLENKTVKGLSPLTINRTAENKMKVFPHGYTKQATRSGKNKFNIDNGFNYGSGNNSATVNSDGTITTTSNFSGMRNKGTPLYLEKNTDYVISLDIVSITTEASSVRGELELIGYNENDTISKVIYGVAIAETDIGTRMVRVINSGDYVKWALHVSGWYGSGNSGTLVYKNVQIEEGSALTDVTDYEPYGVSPSPDYPSDIKNLGDNINFYDATKNPYEIGSFNYLTGALDNYTKDTIRLSQPFDLSVIKEKYITLSIPKELTIAWFFYEKDKSSVIQGSYKNNSNFVTIEIPEKAKYIMWRVLTTDVNIKTKLQQGTIKTSYTPYNCGSVDLKVSNKNFFSGTLRNGVKGNSGGLSYTDVNIYRYVDILLPVGTYKYKQFDIANFRLIRQVNLTMKQDLESSFTLSKPCVVSFTFRKTDNSEWDLGEDASVIPFMLSKSDVDNSTLIEGKSQIVSFPLSEGQLLHKGDYLAEDGIHQVRKTVLVDGTETNWAVYTDVVKAGITRIGYVDAIKNLGVKKNSGTLKCSHFYYVETSPDDTYVSDISSANFYFGIKNETLGVTDDTSNADKLTAWKNWLVSQSLNGIPLKVEAELEEEIIIPYTEEQEYVLNHIYSYEETTNIDIINEFETEIDVEYTPQFLKKIKDKFIKGPTFGRIHITDTNEDFTQDNYLKDFSVSELRFVPDKGLFGGCVAKKVDVNFNNVNKQFSIQDKEFEAYLGVDYEDERYEIKYGTFIVQHPETEDTTDNTSFTALDYMIKFNQKYIDYVTYPCTLRDIAESICIQAGVTLAEEKFRNDDFIVENNQFVNGENLRQVLQGIALSAFSWARVDENNELHFDLNQKEGIDIELTPDEYYNLSKDDYIYGPINRIIIRDSQIEGENVTIDDEKLQNYAIGKNLFNGIFLDGAFSNTTGAFYATTNSVASKDFTRILGNKTVYFSNNGEATKVNIFQYKLDGTFVGKVATATSHFFEEDCLIKFYRNNTSYDKFQVEYDKRTQYEEPILSGVCELVIEDNPFAYTQEKREQLIEAAKELFGFRYMPINDVSLIGLAFLNSKDKIRFNTLDGDVFDTYLFDHTINYNGVILDNVQSKALTKTETKYIYKPDITQAIKNTQITVDKANQKIDTIVKKQDEQSSQLVNIETDLSGVHTTIQDNQKDIEEKINEIEQTIEGTKQTLTYKGGNNIFYYAKEFWNNGTEGGTANLEELTSDTEIQLKSVSGNAYIINKGTSEQKNIVKNDTYTISFTYKKLIDLATGYVDINGTIIDLTSTSWKEEVETIEIDTNTIDIKIVSDTANAFKIFDLMGAVGNEKQVWTQNPNETRTDTVTIGKGIQVNSSSKNTYTRLDADGTRIYNSDTGLPVTEFTQQGVDTDKITADVGQVGGILIQVIDGQTWFSSLL